MPQKVLVVEDEEDLQRLLFFHLTKEGYAVICADSGPEALRRMSQELVNLVLLDIMLPGMDGIEVCKRMRRNRSLRGIPVVMLTAKTQEAEILHGFEAGADDYITKPFSTKVLKARIRAVLRRSCVSPASKRDVLRPVGGLELRLEGHKVLLHGREVPLTASEFGVLRLLAAHPGRVFTRERIIKEIRGENFNVTSRAVDVLIHGLRKKLKEMGRIIETVRGIGYRMKGVGE